MDTLILNQDFNDTSHVGENDAHYIHRANGMQRKLLAEQRAINAGLRERIDYLEQLVEDLQNKLDNK